ncbi:plasmid recombination protein, partial [Escherichia coli]|uniref:plasmid recombination protein n=1 Tax=Escherichia coli TaxID=562 RepID=UPI001486AD30
VSKSTDQAMGRVRELLPEKRRKDAVLAVEYVMTASPEWWTEATPRQQAEFFARSEQWLEKKYGKDRVVAAVVHRDEATP